MAIENTFKGKLDCGRGVVRSGLPYCSWDVTRGHGAALEKVWLRGDMGEWSSQHFWNDGVECEHGGQDVPVPFFGNLVEWDEVGGHA